MRVQHVLQLVRHQDDRLVAARQQELLDGVTKDVRTDVHVQRRERVVLETRSLRCQEITIFI